MSAALVGDWARLLFGSFQSAGIRDVIVSPGSRSTPFVWGACETPGLTVHSVWDERSAAFFALGLARVTGRPALLLCTSGTAAAHYYPAVVEASAARLPLLVLSADRPFELQHADAAQTIDQVKLFGQHARRFFDLGVPEADAGVLAALPRIAAQAVLESRHPDPGPVHLNCRARKPLEPGPATTPAERELSATVDRLLARGVTLAPPPRVLPDEAVLDALAERLRAARRGLIVCGPLPAAHGQPLRAALAAVADRLDMPVYAEAVSQLRFGAPEGPVEASGPAPADALEWLLGSAASRAELAPDLVLRLGGTPTSAALERLLAASLAPAAPELHLIAEHGFPDPSNAARTLVRGPVLEVLCALAERLAGHLPAAGQREYAAAVRQANGLAWRAVDAELAAGGEELSEPSAVRAVVEELPAGALLVLGNSLPIREVDAYAPGGPRPLGVLSQRGANGIDGLISGAAGAAVGAAAVAAAPTVLLVGDVSFAHDLGGLGVLRTLRLPVVVVVLDNGGGRIFEQLPVARFFGESRFADLFLTPTGLDLEHAGPLFGIPSTAPRDLAGLRAAVREGLGRSGPSLVHVRVPARSHLTVKERVLARFEELRLAPAEAALPGPEALPRGPR